MNPIIFSEKIDSKLSLIGLATAIAFLYLFGVHGFLRSAPLGADFLIFHKAAVFLLQGENPWWALKDTGEPFSYPPHIAAALLFYGLLPAKVALAFHTLLNVVSILVIAYFSNKWFLKISDIKRINLYQAVSLATIFGNPFMAHSVFEGQITLPACAAVILSWHFLQHKKLLLSGVFLGLASIKPQVAIFFIVWLLLRREIWVVLFGATLSLLLMLPAIIIFGPIDVLNAWLSSIQSYSAVAVNQPGSSHVVGLESFFVAVGVLNSGPVFKLASLLSIGLVYAYRHYLNDILIVNGFFILPLTFLFGHDTGYAAVIMLWAYMLYLGLGSARLLNITIAILLTLTFFFPQRLLREIDITALHHTRTFILVLACYFAFRWSRAATLLSQEERDT